MRLRVSLIVCLILSVAALLSISADAQERIKMATTTSTENSGLLEKLLPPFEELFGVRVDVIAVGTGKALKLGENGDVDVVLVHSREAEDKFISDGFGVNRRDVMYNDFVLVGPLSDPAGIKDMTDAVEVFKKISEKKVPFVSRGDDSGTHKREKSLWELAGIEPNGSWYMETGQGMDATLRIADEEGAYTLVDRGTLLAYRAKIDLKIISEGDPKLLNPYGIIAVNPERHPHVNYVYAMALIGWVTSQKGQRIIGDYKKDGKVLFHPLVIGDW